MTIFMVRDDCTETRSLGTMTFDDGFVCHTLEDPVRDVKIAGETAIPSGTYRVTITMSTRFGKPLPSLANVPNFSGIRIHPGNTTADTSGCILVATSRGQHDDIVSSKEAMEQVQKRIAACIAEGDVVWLDIVTPRVTTSETFVTASMADATGFP